LTTDYGYEYEVIIPFDIGGVIAEETIVKPGVINLQNYPNPFNPSTTISFTTEDIKSAEIEIFNIKGQLIKTLNVTLRPESSLWKGSVGWNGTNDAGKPVSSGVYLYKLEFGKFTQTKKMLLMR